jgi:hypothetical protein
MSVLLLSGKSASRSGLLWQASVLLLPPLLWWLGI